MSEEWREIPGFPGYEASSEGRIKSTYGAELCQNILIRGKKGPSTYLAVAITLNEKRTKLKVHKAVALAFLGPRPEGLQVIHLDEDPTNNRSANLKYGTQSENVRRSNAHRRGETF
jgi:hypothetical protein